MNKTVTNDGRAKQRNFKIPHTYVIIFAFLLIMAVMTYIIPAGEYERVLNEATNKKVVNPESFGFVEQQGVSLMTIATSVTLGMQDSGSIIFFIFIIGGVMQIIFATGAVDRGVATLARRTSGKGRIFIPIFMAIFAAGGVTFGLSNEVVVFVPIGVALAHALGYDAITGVAMIALGAAVGFNAGFVNPFTTGIAQGIAGLPMFSGITYRIIVFALMFPVTLWYVMKYADKVKKDPSESLVKDCVCELEKADVDINNVELMTLNDKLVFLILIVGILGMVYGVFFWGWYMDEMAGIFMCMGILAGLVGKLSPGTIAGKFVEGAKEMTFGALVIGLAKGMLIVMQDGKIIDTFIYGIANVISVLPKSIASIGMFFFLSIFNFFVPSSSGMAATVMPILVPLSDVVGITRQTAVLAYQFGDGISNSIIPTSSVVMSYLAVSKIPYERWLKFVWPITAIWMAMCVVFMGIATMINYGPF